MEVHTKINGSYLKVDFIEMSQKWACEKEEMFSSSKEETGVIEELLTAVRALVHRGRFLILSQVCQWQSCHVSFGLTMF